MDLPGWDSLDTVTRYHSIAEIAGIVLLGLLVIAEVMSYRYSHRKDYLTDTKHDAEIARLHRETAALTADANKSRAEIAQANARALEAQVALEKYKAPRRLSAEAQAAIAHALGADLKGVKFALSAIGPEPLDLANDTGDALMAAGMIWIDWPLPGTSLNDPARGHTVGQITLNGTVVRVWDPKLIPARTRLVEALTAPEFEETRPEGPGAGGPPGAERAIPGADFVVVMIGTKR
jgi:hypothetical protein